MFTTISQTKLVSKVIDSDNNSDDLITLLTYPYFYDGRGRIASVNHFIENLTVTSKIFSIPIASAPVLDPLDTEYQQAYKIQQKLYENPHKILEIFIGSGNDTNSFTLRDEEIIDRDYSPSKSFYIHDKFTDQIAIKLGDNGNIAFRCKNLVFPDKLTITCSHTIEYVIDTAPDVIASSTPFGIPLQPNTSTDLLSQNNNRKLVAITNTSPSADVFVNLGDTAYIGQGICLKSNGGNIVLNTYETRYYGRITAITQGSNVLVTGLEGT